DSIGRFQGRESNGDIECAELPAQRATDRADVHYVAPFWRNVGKGKPVGSHSPTVIRHVLPRSQRPLAHPTAAKFVAPGHPGRLLQSLEGTRRAGTSLGA